MARSHCIGSSEPRRFQRGPLGSLTVWLIALCVLFGALGIIGWQAGWWFRAENVERQVHIDNRNTGVQTAWHDQAVDGVRQFYLIPEGNSAARGAVRNQTCDLISRLVPEYITPDLTQFQQEEC